MIFPKGSRPVHALQLIYLVDEKYNIIGKPFYGWEDVKEKLKFEKVSQARTAWKEKTLINGCRLIKVDELETLKKFTA